MKKLVYSLAVLFSVALVSCGGNKAENNDSANDTVTVESISETVTDSLVVDSAAPAADSVVADSAK